MTRHRKQIGEIIHSIRSLKDRHEYWRDEFVRLSGKEGFATLQQIYNDLITKLTQEKESMPIGYRYSKDFYIKVPYTLPVQYEKINGSAFMREDLVSWRIEADERYKHSYFRAIYRDKSNKENSEIRKEEATPVYGDRQEIAS